MSLENAALSSWQDLEPMIYQKAVAALAKRKMYASARDWPNKQTKERGIVCDLLKSVEDDFGYCDIKTVRACKQGDDPPDCIGITIDGKLIAFEVTELVDQKTVEKNLRGIPTWKDWNCEELLAKIDKIIKEKDSKQYRGEPFSNIILVIHTDEPMLRLAEYVAMIPSQTVFQCHQISEVYLLLPQKPGQANHPFRRLQTTSFIWG